MKGVVHVQFMGRLGNCIFSYCFGRAYAERHGCAFRTDPWEGEQIFEIQHERQETALKARNENDLVEGEVDFTYRSYSQQQKCLIYSREQVRQWLRFKPEIEAALAGKWPGKILAHRRVGDYVGYDYPIVSRQSYLDACIEHGLNSGELEFITEENPTMCPGAWPDYLPDFYRLAKAPVLLRGNSSFSFWAGVLNLGRVLSPVISGLPGGEHEGVKFVKGLWPRISDHGFVSDLHFKEEA